MIDTGRICPDPECVCDGSGLTTTTLPTDPRVDEPRVCSGIRDALEVRDRLGLAETDNGPFDPEELVRWAELYGNPEGWAKKAQDLCRENEKLQAQLHVLRAGAEGEARDPHNQEPRS